MLLLTRRKDQVTYRNGPCIIICETVAGRDAWIKRLSNLHPLRFNGPALQFGHKGESWLPAWIKNGDDYLRPYIIQ